MIKLIKTRPLPNGVNISKREDWAHNTPVRALLEFDCHCKCYICEDKPKDTTSLTVDHVVSVDREPRREFDWDNLLLACRRCNNEVKGNHYNDIINPADESGLDPEAAINFNMSYDLRDVSITVSSNDKSAVETEQLLNAVYSDRILTRKIAADVRKLNECIPFASSGEDWAVEYIAENITRSSQFAAFKRKFIRDDPVLSQQFAPAML